MFAYLRIPSPDGLPNALTRSRVHRLSPPRALARSRELLPYREGMAERDRVHDPPLLQYPRWRLLNPTTQFPAPRGQSGQECAFHCYRETHRRCGERAEITKAASVCILCVGGPAAGWCVKRQTFLIGACLSSTHSLGRTFSVTNPAIRDRVHLYCTSFLAGSPRRVRIKFTAFGDGSRHRCGREKSDGFWRGASAL